MKAVIRWQICLIHFGPVYWDWYRDVNGNKTSVLRTNESHVVVNNYIVLMEIPMNIIKFKLKECLKFLGQNNY